MSLARVILLDPDLALARTLTRIIRDAEYDVTAISRLQELAPVLAEAPVDLLLIDLAGVGDDVKELRRLLDDSTPRPSVLLLSSLSPDADTYRQLGASPGDFIAKPFRVHELLARIRSHLRDRTPLPEAEAPHQRASAAVMTDMTTGLTSAEVFQLLVRRVAQGLRIPRCSIILAQVGHPQGTVVAAYDNPTINALPVDLTRYPEILRAMATGEVVHVGDVSSHPLYDDVRDSWRADGRSQPVTSAIAIRFSLRGRPAGVFFLRTTERDAPLDEQDVAFARQIVDAAVRTLERIVASDTGLPAAT